LELEHARRLRDCIQSSATIVSSASTARGEAIGDVASVVAESEVFDFLPHDPNEHMLRWIYEYEDKTKPPDDVSVSGSTYVVGTVSYPSDDADSDDDLEVEITLALFNSYKDKIAQNDFDSAERLLKNCHSRVFDGVGGFAPRYSKKQPLSALGLLDAQLELYTKQEKWTEAQAVARERISFREQSSESNNSQELLADILLLSDILAKCGTYTEAQLQGRRALRGYRKLGLPGRYGMELALNCLVQISVAMDNTDEAEGYRILLADSISSKYKSTDIGTSHLLEVSSSKISLSESILVMNSNLISSSSNILDEQNSHVNGESNDSPGGTKTTAPLLSPSEAESPLYIPPIQSSTSLHDTSTVAHGGASATPLLPSISLEPPNILVDHIPAHPHAPKNAIFDHPFKTLGNAPLNISLEHANKPPFEALKDIALNHPVKTQPKSVSIQIGRELILE
jgi:hypothetical protein